MADNFPPLVCLSKLHIDCNALPLILKGLMKYLPSGNTLVKIHSQNDRKPLTTTRIRSKSKRKNIYYHSIQKENIAEMNQYKNILDIYIYIYIYLY